MWKKIAKNAMLLLTGIIISRIFLLLYRLILLRELSEGDYAIFALIISTFSWICIFSHFDIYSALSKYTSEFLVNKDEKKQWDYYYNGLLLMLILSTISIPIGILLTTFFVSFNIFSLIILYVFIIPFSFMTVTDGIIRGYQIFKKSAIISSTIGTSRLVIVLLFLAIFTTLSLDYIIVAWGLSLLIPAFVSFILIKKLNGYNNLYKSKFDLKIIKKIFNFSLWFTITDLCIVGMLLFSRYYVSLYSSIDVVLLDIAILFTSIFRMAFGSIVNAIIPKVSEKIASNERIRILGLKEFSYIFILISSIIMVILLFPYTTEFLLIILGKESYVSVIYYLPLILLTLPFRLLSITYSGVLAGMGETKFLGKLSIIMLIGTMMSVFLLYNSFQLYGVFYSLLIIFIFEFLVKKIYTERKMKSFQTQNKDDKMVEI